MRPVARFFGILTACLGILTGEQASGQEKYAGVTFGAGGWMPREMQTFAGTIPSRAWVFGREDKEIMASGMVTEGIATGLMGQSLGGIAKIYAESVVVGWGGRTKGESRALDLADFCGGLPGAVVTAAFGATSQTYYACVLARGDLFRVVTAMTWFPGEASEENQRAATEMLVPFTSGVDMRMQAAEP